MTGTMKLARVGAVIAAVGVTVGGGVAEAKPGPLDRSFGRAGVGWVIGGEGAALGGMAANGSPYVVLAGTGNGVNDYQLHGLDRRGRLVAAFGGTGLIAENFFPAGVASLGSGEGFVTAGNRLTLVTQTSEGKLNSSGANGGISSVDLGDRAAGAGAIAVVPGTKKSLVGGWVREAGGLRMVVVRFNEDGTVDRTYGTAGAAVIAPDGTGPDRNQWLVCTQGMGVRALVARGDGSVFAVGALPQAGNADPAGFVAKLSADGHLDPTFGTAGVARVQDAGRPTGLVSALARAGRLDVAGTAGSPYPDCRALKTRSRFFVAALDSTGNPVRSYGNNGVVKVAFPYGARAGAATGVAGGKTVIVGRTLPSYGHWALARLTRAGKLDRTFGGGRICAVGAGYGATAVQGTDGGKLIVAGAVGDYFKVMRFNRTFAKPPAHWTRANPVDSCGSVPKN
jgi:uncharacterized delta-60 repeat protein